MEYHVTVSNHALDEMVLAASESFVLGNARQWGAVEIHGYLWGSRRETEDVEYIDVDKFSVSTSAVGDEESVAFDERVARIKNSILGYWSPHYHFLGSFHTHPYPSLEDVNNNKGWEFSDDDKATILGDEDVWELSHPGTPIAMVMAVTKMAAVYDSFVGVKAGRLEFNVGNLRFWLSVAVGEVSSGKEKVFSTDNILFNPHSRHYNRAGARLDGVD